MDNFIQITVFCPPKPRVGAFVYRNAGKFYYGQNSRKLKRDKLPGFFSRVFQFRSFVCTLINNVRENMSFRGLFKKH